LKYKLFVKNFIKYFLIISFIIISINYIVDPLFTFKSTQNINIKQKDFNERIQKTNFLYYINSDFDSLLLGNSRSTYINTQKIDKNKMGKVFNYAVNAMSVEEYDSVIQNFIQITGKQPKVILIGVDPFNFGENKSEDLKIGLKNSSDFFYPFRSLFSLDLFKISLKNLITTYKFENDIYDRKQRFYDKNLLKGIQKVNKISNERYIVVSKNSDMKITQNHNLELLKILKKKYNKSKFVIFTMPVHQVIVDSIMEDKNSYFLWLESLVNSFGIVYHFMYENNISKSYYTFFDAFHFYPYVGDKIIDKINNNTTDINNSFGIILNKENIKNYYDNTIQGF